MKLDIDAFRLIKPAGTNDSYLAGQMPSGKFKMSYGAINKAYREQIINLLNKNGGMTTLELSNKMNVHKSTISGVLNKMIIKEQAYKGDKVIRNGRKSFVYFAPGTQQ
jgi:predicted transcriptional regulator